MGPAYLHSGNFQRLSLAASPLGSASKAVLIGPFFAFCLSAFRPETAPKQAVGCRLGKSAALAATSSSRSPTAVAATDTINLNLASGAATSTAYRYWVSAVTAGSFKVCVENRSAGSLSEALVLNFAVVKAVAA